MKYLLILCVFSFFISSNTYSQSRWWQREIPEPSANQMVNPNYLSKKRELEQTFDGMNDMIRERNNSVQLGHTEAVKSADEMLQFINKKINILENELSKIPIYILNPSYNNSNNKSQNINQLQNNININEPTNVTPSITADNSYLLTLYKIQNFDKNNFENDYDYNAKSLDLFNELKGNISKIVETKTNISNSSIEFIKEEIKYYEVFIKNWGEGNPIGTQEAKNEIINLNNEIDIIEKTVFKGGSTLSQGIFYSPEEKKYIHPEKNDIYLNVSLPKLQDNAYSNDFGYPNINRAGVEDYVKNGNHKIASILLESNGKIEEYIIRSNDFEEFEFRKISGRKYELTSSYEEKDIYFSNFKINCHINFKYELLRRDSSVPWSLYGVSFRVFINEIILL